ncbi:transcriptional regulator [Pseudoalteromonas sp. HM-SA03]|uniref:LysR family transcriptional regulator n=1 Tax=Pseudoalteromonas sp. HM-SA03 TaxID=2029678 RepID=UPI000BAE20BF|nr:LysR family transcriptional regulator [Pseudoalteromonas sp. HM-SA03]PAY02693.1 transcriptional regulator [Pseudoalteromonas sp. HM-SA03]
MTTSKHIELLQEMSIFVSVVNTGSFSKSARQLGVSPSSVSRAIKLLEQQLGVCLLQRTTRSLRLSETGRAVYERCTQLEQAAKDVISLCESYHQTAQGTVKIAAPKAVAHSLIHPNVMAFLGEFPNIDVHLVLDDNALDLIRDEIDILFKITNEPPQGLIGRSVMIIEHIVAASPKYLATHSIPTHPKELVQHSCIALGETDADAKWRFRKGTQKLTTPVNGRYKANHTRVRLDAALQGLGITSLPMFVAKDALASGELIQVLPEWQFETHYSGELWMLYPATRHIPAKVSIFADFIVQRLTKTC